MYSVFYKDELYKPTDIEAQYFAGSSMGLTVSAQLQAAILDTVEFDFPSEASANVMLRA